MPVALSVSDRIATITINRPDKLNALNAEVIRRLGEIMDEIESRNDVGGILLTGAGRAFVAGADIGELADADAVSGRALAARGQSVFRKFEVSRRPVIAAVNGFALGGGCELAMACHVRIASEAAKFGQPEVKLGLCPGYGGTQRLPRLVGRGRALQLLLTGEMIDAQEALRIGLVNSVVPAEELLPTAERMLRDMLANAPLALAACIESVDVGLEAGQDAGLAHEAAHFGLLAASADMKEGTAAFLEKRAPKFQGR
jgi:enoyl-CoA hydratase